MVSAIHCLINCFSWDITIRCKSFSKPPAGLCAEIDRSNKKSELNTTLINSALEKEEAHKIYRHFSLPSRYRGIRYIGVGLILKGWKTMGSNHGALQEINAEHHSKWLKSCNHGKLLTRVPSSSKKPHSFSVNPAIPADQNAIIAVA